MSPTSETRLVDDVVHLGDLEIGFVRTVRVPDNEEFSELPPGLGLFPLFPVRQYAETFPPDMVPKGGLFLPMYQREALWIRFQSICPYAIKVYAGTVNTVSGEPAVETAGTRLRRQNLIAQNKSIQDYIVTPAQPWLDGFATGDGKVRQFVAMPLGLGYTVEGQVTGEEQAGGLQFEITPCKNLFQIFVELEDTDEKVPLDVHASECFGDILKKVQRIKKTSYENHSFFWMGWQLDSFDYTLEHFEIPDGSIFHLRNVRPRMKKAKGFGGSRSKLPKNKPQPKGAELGIAAGGLIKQSIVKDPICEWDSSQTKVFNVQILSSETFLRVTGHLPPETPIDMKTYAKLGLPFFSVNETNASVHGDFSGVKSVAQLQGESEASVRPQKLKLLSKIINWNSKSAGKGAWECKVCSHRNKQDGKWCEMCERVKSEPSRAPARQSSSAKVLSSKSAALSDGFTNTEGPMTKFRDIRELETEIGKREFLSF